MREVTIESPSPAGVIAFYAGLGLATEDDEGVRIGTSVLRFAAGEPTAPYHFAFNIPSNRIADAKEWIASRATMLSDETFDFDTWNAEAVYFADADGNIIELIARRGLNNPSDETFGSDLFLEISEVGVAVADPPVLVDELERTLGLDVYDGDRRTFTALGDEHALFIVVSVGRAWLPTDQPAADLPMRAVVEAPRAGSIVHGNVEIVATPC